MSKTSQKQPDPFSVARLSDIEPEEVSIVDRAANKRRFLVIKRRDSMSDGTEELEVVESKPAEEQEEEEPKEEEVPAEKQEDMEEEEEEEEEVPAEKQEGAEEEAPAEKQEEPEEEEEEEVPAEKSQLKISGIAKQALMSAARTALEKLVGVVDLLKSAEITEEETSTVPEEIGSELIAVTRLLGGIGGQPAPAKSEKAEEPEEEEEVPAEKSEPEAAPTEDAPASSFAADLQILQGMLDTLSKREPAKPTIDTEALLAKVSEVIKGELDTRMKMIDSRIAELEKAEGLPNSQPVESPRNDSPVQTDEVWPSDMANKEGARPDIKWD